MGILRTALALAVVIAHIHMDRLAQIGGAGAAVMAVKLFFMLSGFYMALVLDQKYGRDAIAFYKARAMRLFPLYWVTIIATLCFFALVPTHDGFFQSVRSTDWPTLGLAIGANLTFLGLDAGGLLCFQGWPGCYALVQFTVVPQAWTLGTEVLFYAAAPWIARGGLPAILTIFLLSLGTKVAIVFMGLGGTPWGRQFIGAELVYFMLGMLSYEGYRVLQARMTSPLSLETRTAFWPLLPISLCLIVYYEGAFTKLYYSRPHLIDIALDPPFFLAFALIIPPLFHMTRDSIFHKPTGDLSYPIYITHFLAISMMRPLLDAMTITNAQVRFWSYMAAVIVVAILGYVAVVRPIEAMRRKALAIK